MASSISEKATSLPAGFPSLGHFVASEPDAGTVVFRRFDSLSARNLLFLQSQLADLEAEQRDLDTEDVESINHEERASRQDWKLFETRSEDTTSPFHEREQRRMQLARRIQKTLKQYRIQPSILKV